MFTHRKSAPKQENGSDCGVFILLFSRYTLADQKLTFKSSEIDEFREKIKNEIYNKKLKDDISFFNLE